MAETILWRRLDRPGHEAARLELRGSLWHLEGSAVFSHQGSPCRLDYLVACDAGFGTRSGRVAGWIGERRLELDIRAESGRWWVDGTSRPEVEGAIDLDLNFSPSTNLLPLRRLNLAIGEEAPVRAAWLRFPSFELEPLEQSYRRIEASRYRYESDTGFVAELEVEASGFVKLYPELCRREDSP